MKPQTFCLFYLLFLSFLITNCTSTSFIAKGKTPFKIASRKKSDQLIEVKSRGDFYFWGNSPSQYVINLEDYSNRVALDLPAFVAIEQSINWESFFYTIITLGIYSPINYKISLLTEKGQEK